MKKPRNEFASKNDVRFDDEFQRFAHRAELRAKPITNTSQEVVVALASEIIEALVMRGNYKYRKQGQKLAEFEQAVSGFVYDLLKGVDNKAARGWVGAAFSSAKGSRENTGYRYRIKIRDGMEYLRWIEVSSGDQFVTKHPFGGLKPAVKEGRTTRLRATELLLAKLSASGIDQTNYREHFFVELPKWTIKLRAKSKKIGSYKVRGREMSVSREDETTRALDAKVQEINHFLIGQSIERAPFSGYIRQFNNGDVDGFNWNKGGRLYASFQQLSALERKAITINHQPVVEIDVSASYLTILHGLAKEPFDTTRDAYKIDNVERDAVKSYISQALGLGCLPKRWAPKLKEKFYERHRENLSEKYPLAKISDVVIAHYPIIGRLEEIGIDWSDLMYVESEAMLTAMLVMMRSKKIPSLVVHDALIIPKAELDCAILAIEESYHARCGIRPRLKVKDEGDSDFKDLEFE